MAGSRPAAAAVLLAAAAPAVRGEWVLEFQNASDAVNMGTSYFHYSSDPAIRYGTPMSIESNVTICVWLKNPTPSAACSATRRTRRDSSAIGR